MYYREWPELVVKLLLRIYQGFCCCQLRELGRPQSARDFDFLNYAIHPTSARRASLTIGVNSKIKMRNFYVYYFITVQMRYLLGSYWHIAMYTKFHPFQVGIVNPTSSSGKRMISSDALHWFQGSCQLEILQKTIANGCQWGSLDRILLSYAPSAIPLLVVRKGQQVEHRVMSVWFLDRAVFTIRLISCLCEAEVRILLPIFYLYLDFTGPLYVTRAPLAGYSHALWDNPRHVAIYHALCRVYFAFAKTPGRRKECVLATCHLL